MIAEAAWSSQDFVDTLEGPGNQAGDVSNDQEI
jgi:hypothetical protein